LTGNDLKVEQPVDFDLVDGEAVVAFVGTKDVTLIGSIGHVHKALEGKIIRNGNLTEREARSREERGCDSNLVFHSM
jgi:hypothetical protein